MRTVSARIARPKRALRDHWLGRLLFVRSGSEGGADLHACFADEQERDDRPGWARKPPLLTSG
jgi:hypothetical protein